MDKQIQLQEVFQLLSETRWSEAELRLKDLSAVSTEVENYWFACAVLAVSTGDVQKGIVLLEKELQLFPTNVTAKQLYRDLIRCTAAPAGTPSIAQLAKVSRSQSDLAFRLRCALCNNEARQRAFQAITRLEPDYWLERDLERYSYGIEHSSFWFDQPMAVNWLARALKPAYYLEVGVRRGRTMAQVVSESPQTAIFGFDMWIPDYGSNTTKGILTASPGPEFVLSELKKFNSTAAPTFVVGDSQDTLPQFFARPDVPQQFELMVIDGDHTYAGAKFDLDIAFQHLAPGGVIVFDDIYHHAHPELLSLWRSYQSQYPDYLFAEDHHSTGTGIAVRPPFTKIERALHDFETRKGQRLRVMMPYSIKRELGAITLPEWIKQSFRAYFTDELEVFACGPGNEIDLPDGPDFYEHVARLCDELNIDFLLDVEGGAESFDFMFRRFPTSVKIPKIYWAIDTHQYLREQKLKASHFDFCYSAQKNAVPELGPNSEWLPAGASLHEEDYQRERNIPLAFIGSISESHKKRAEVLSYLAQNCPEFQIFSGVFLEDKAELTSSVKIAVNVSLNNDVNFRVFETLACGALLLTDHIEANGQEDLFRDGEHLVVYRSKEELVEKVRYYLTHDEEREQIARGGKAVVDSKFRHHVLLKRLLHQAKSLIAARNTDDCARRNCFCGGTLTRTAHPLYAACSVCGTQVLKRQYTPEELKQFYTAEGYWHERQVSVFNFPPIEERAEKDFLDRIPVWYDTLARYMPKPKQLLEIGCAHGGFLHYCRERGAENVVGIEVDDATCQFARARFDLPHVMSGLFPQVSLPFSCFDAITGFDVIEHFIDPIEGLHAVADLLADDGICFFQTPWYRGEGQEWSQYKPAEHTFLFSEKGIRLLFEQVGLEVVSIQQGFFPDDMFVVGRKSAAAKTILIIRTDSVGDNLLATPLLDPIHRRYKDAKIVVACQERVAPIYQNHPAVSQIVSFDRNRLATDSDYLAKTVDSLKSLNADIVINSVYSREALTDTLAIGAEGKVSYAFVGNFDNIDRITSELNNQHYTFLVESDPSNIPEVLRNTHLLSALGISDDVSMPQLYLSEEDRFVAAKLYRDLELDPTKTIVVAPTAQYQIKNYAEFGNVLFELSKRRDLTIVALGSPGEEQIQREILRPIAGRYIDLCGQLDLRQSAAVIEQSRFLLGVDSALAHFACALGVPSLVIMGGGHFGRFFPYSAKTSLVTAPISCYQCNWRCQFARPLCIDSIPASFVVDVVNHLLDEPIEDNVTESARVFVHDTSTTSGGIGVKPLDLSTWASQCRVGSIELILPCASGANSKIAHGPELTRHLPVGGTIS